MRKLMQGPVLTVKAVSGLHVVVLAWDFTAPQQVDGGPLPDRLKDLMGFAIEREQKSGDEAGEHYMLRGIKRFEDKDKGLAAGTPVPLSEHPAQSFLWADYTAKPGITYAYRVIPLYGAPKSLTPDDAATATIEITTEPEVQPDGGDGSIRHDIYFNRGVIGSQAYSREFPGEEPDPAQPDSGPMVWLSRGLFEALLGFIRRAENEHYALRCAFYEFRYPAVARQLRTAIEAGADVKIVYDAESSYKTENVQTLQNAELMHTDIQIPRTVTEGIRHNKFMVLLKDGTPIAVWTGSTNISAGGIFGHSNVGHVVWDQGIAKTYLEYWERLAKNFSPTKLRPLNRQSTPTPNGKTPPNSVVALLSARDEKESLETLQWYADRMDEAKRLVCFTLAFNLDQVFSDVICKENDVLRYVVKDDALSPNETIGRDHDVLFAAGGRFEEGDLKNFMGERDNPLNTNDYIHTKIMLVDPLSDDPLVVTGSANFSRPSQRTNDENMLVIRGNTRVADVYFGEFMRIFDHHYARYVVHQLQSAHKSDPSAGYLKTTADEWVRPHFDDNGYKAKRRRYFTEP